MEVLRLLIALAEKMGLLAAAALVAVLFPPLRNRLLGVGRRRDKLAAVVFGLGLSVWGATLGLRVGSEHVNMRAIGVLIGAILGGRKAGALAGLGGGLFYAAQVDEETSAWVLAASVTDGVIAGMVAAKAPQLFHGFRAFVTSLVIQTIHLVLVGLGLLMVGHAARYLPAWPAHAVTLVVSSAGVYLFVVVARLVVAREEGAVALVKARAAANAASLEALRRKLEPHFLFNALNALRATIRRDPVRARELVADLADLYRYILSHPEDAPIRDEVGHACAYLAIERVRLGDERLSWQIDVPKEIESVAVPGLLLQPLVENAVQHGISLRNGPGVITISARQESGDVVIEVRDESEGSRLHPVRQGTGIALPTLRARLAQRFGPQGSLVLTIHATGSVATVRVPMAASATSISRSEATVGLAQPVTS